MKYFTNKWEYKIRDYIDASYTKVDVIPGKIKFNDKCHMNAAHYALKKKDEKLALVTYRRIGVLLPIVHFVNYHDGSLIDNTIGEWATQYEYRFIRWVAASEFYDVQHILKDTQTMFANMATPLQKFFGDCAN